jgi:hypothetical protein
MATAVLLRVRATAAPPAGAGAVRVNKQSALEPAGTAVGVQVNDDNLGAETAAFRAMVTVFMAPGWPAETTADSPVVTAAAVIANVALLALRATMTEAGTVRCGLLLETGTAMADGAAAESVTVQVSEPGPVMELAPHPKEETAGVTAEPDLATVTPVPETETALPLADAPNERVIPKAALDVDAPRIMDIFATTPFGMLVPLRPHTTHV